MNDDTQHWHHSDAGAVLTILETDEQGLSTQRAHERLIQYGPNQLPEAKTRGPWRRFIDQFNNVLIYVLLIACAVTALLGEWLDASVIFGVVIANALIGFVQEGKAVDALQAIRQLLSPQARVLRDGEPASIPARELVPGDIVLVESGDKIVADLRLLRCKNLLVEEAALTGESIPVEKTTDSIAADAELGDRRNMVYSGTMVTAGQGTGVVVATGRTTEIGRISSLVAGVEALSTPLLRQMTAFGRWLTAAILITALLIFAFGVWVRDYAITDMFLAMVGLSVAAIPEGLPAIMTITLAIGVQRMARRKAIIRRLPAIETLGAVSVICSDKTGTLTRNEMTVCSVITASNEYHFEGTGYSPAGNIHSGETLVDPTEHSVLNSALHSAVLCSDATLEHSDDHLVVHGDPTEGALLVAGLKANIGQTDANQHCPRLDLIPFESEHRFMATLHQQSDQSRIIFVKGAPERILGMCHQQQEDTGEHPLQLDHWQRKIAELASQGQRVLAVATKTGYENQQTLSMDDVEHGMVMLGLFGLIDPPRDEAVDSMRLCQSAGIDVKMITGDHAVTASAIAQQLGFDNAGEVLTGRDLSMMDDDALQQRVNEVSVYARVSPEHKLRLVQQLQSQRQIVAMTGDGVNDSPALKRSDIGIAMGHKGTEAAKEASEMVLADDNFSSIVDAIKEGRTVFDNLRKAILFILPTSGGEALIIMTAVVLGFQQLPLTPVQILWVNMVTTVTLALALAFEPPEAGVMQRPPRPSDAPLLSPLLIWRIAFVSLILMVGTVGVFQWALAHGASIEYARTSAVNTLVLFECFYLFNARYIRDSVISWRGITGNRWVLIAITGLFFLQLAFSHWAPLQRLFSTAALTLQTWGVAAAASASVFILVELEKAATRVVTSRKNTD